MFRYIFSIIILLLSLGCSYIPSPQNKQDNLYNLLLTLDSNISKDTAKKLSTDIISFSTKLKHDYQPIIEPHFNNFLINIGLKKRGLCYEWSDALYLHFIKQHYQNFRFHLIVSHQGEYWREHNAFAITNSNNNISKGIIIDLWRDIDNIYINYIFKDTSYQWKRREKRECFR